MKWKHKRWPWWLKWAVSTKTRSTTLPWGVIYLRDGAFPLATEHNGPNSPAIHVLIQHEGVHVHQMKAHRGWIFGPWIWALRYLLSAKFRLSQEIEAEAVEAWMRASLLGVPVEAKHVSHGLRPGGIYKLPKGTDREAITAEILSLARMHESRWTFCSDVEFKLTSSPVTVQAKRLKADWQIEVEQDTEDL